MPESGPFGSVRGVCSNAHPYRDVQSYGLVVPPAPSLNRVIERLLWRRPTGSSGSLDRGRERRQPSPPAEPAVQFSRGGLSSQLFPHRDWRAKRWASDSVNSPRSAKKAFGQCW